MLQSGVFEVPEFFNFAEDIFAGWARKSPESLALWCINAQGENQVQWTFRQLWQRTEQAANLFQDRGIRRGDRVLLVLPRIPQWWVVMLGLTRLGAVPVPCTVQLTAKDLAYRAESAGACALVTDEEGALKMENFPGIKFSIGGGAPGWIDFNQALPQATDRFQGERTRSDDPGILYFTSATTGQPKMVLHTQASYGMGHRLTGELWLDLHPGDLHWNLSDPGWGKAAWSSFFGPWHRGACVFSADLRGKFHPSLALRTLANFPITTWCAPPTALRLVVREDLSTWRFPHLRHCVSAGEPLNPEVFALWQAATGLSLYEAYGQTETVVLIGNCRALNATVRPGSMGKAIPGFEVALLDENLNPLPAGHEGEIALRTAPRRPLGLFREYWQNPAENAAQFRQGWYLTGDRARQDADGYFWFVGRKDDVIKSAGYRIGPCEVESALLEHPAVLDAAVVGKPDAMRGHIVKAFVQLRDQVAPSETLKSELQHHCKQVAAPYKYPREIEFVTDLPKTASGKIRRVDLRRRENSPPT
jgi:acyl-coenzyme A synthetase/AMP-(fatty) acid ligase